MTLLMKIKMAIKIAMKMINVRMDVDDKDEEKGEWAKKYETSWWKPVTLKFLCEEGVDCFNSLNRVN